MKKLLITLCALVTLTTLCGGDTQKRTCLQRTIEALKTSEALRTGLPDRLSFCRVITQFPLSKQCADQTLIADKKIENPLITCIYEECPICLKSYEAQTTKGEKTTHNLIIVPCCKQLICYNCYNKLTNCPFCRNPYFTEHAVFELLTRTSERH